MRIDVITLFPDMVQCVTQCGIPNRAIGKHALSVHCWNPRDFTTDNHRTVDDRPYGGGPGMVMLIEPLQKTIHAARKAVREALNTEAKVLYFSPQGETLSQSKLRALSVEPALICLAGRYEGVDERLLQLEVDAEYSIGDYVLSGGELPAMVMIDGIARLLPGVLGDEDSADQDSFEQGILDCPHYTRPEDYQGLTVPPVLLSGNHAAIRRWRRKQALGRTWQRRPDLLAEVELSAEDQQLLQSFRKDSETE